MKEGCEVIYEFTLVHRSAVIGSNVVYQHPCMNDERSGLNTIISIHTFAHRFSKNTHGQQFTVPVYRTYRERRIPTGTVP